LGADAVRLSFPRKERVMNWGEFLSFRRMITPVIIQVVFWLGIAGCVIGGLGLVAGGAGLKGIGAIVLGPLFVRVWCETVIVMFKINDALQDIRTAKRM